MNFFNFGLRLFRLTPGNSGSQNLPQQKGKNVIMNSNYPDRMAPVFIENFQVDFVRNFRRVLHSHMGLETAYVVSGEAKHLICPPDTEPFSLPLTKGTYYVIPYGTRHSFEDGSDDFTVINFMINPNAIDSSLSADVPMEQIEASLFAGQECDYSIPCNRHCYDKSGTVLPLFEELLVLKHDNPAALRGMFRAKAIELLLTILNCNIFDEHKAKKEISELVRDYVNIHYSERINLDEICELFHYAPPYVSRRFKKNFGVSFEDYVQNLRLTHACDLLLGTEMTVEKIAVKMSYSSPSTFRRAFKKQFGVTPNEYRMKFN